jgi:hypothetical protein
MTSMTLYALIIVPIWQAKVVKEYHSPNNDAKTVLFLILFKTNTTQRFRVILGLKKLLFYLKKSAEMFGNMENI